MTLARRKEITHQQTADWEGTLLTDNEKRAKTNTLYVYSAKK